MASPVILRVAVEVENRTAIVGLEVEVEQGREAEALDAVSAAVREAMFRLGFDTKGEASDG